MQLPRLGLPVRLRPSGFGGQPPHDGWLASRSSLACRSSGGWSGRRGSNPRPTAWKAVTLPLSYSRLRVTHFAPRFGGQARRTHHLVPASRFPSPSRLSIDLPSSLRTWVLRLSCRSSPLTGAEGWLANRSSLDKPVRAKVGGEGRTRTFEAARATDLQSAAFDRFATSPTCLCWNALLRQYMSVGMRRFRQCLAEAVRWSWRRDLNPRPADYKSAALPD
jgi:hypothetical protein